MLTNDEISVISATCKMAKSRGSRSDIRALVWAIEPLIARVKNARITARQREVLDTIIGMLDENHCDPTLQQVGDRLGITKAAVHEQVNTLRAAGLLAPSVYGLKPYEHQRMTPT